jgi:thiol-disulfide isomerase/thioredoxin
LIKIYNFNTTWCGWSKRFQPIWDKFTNDVKADNNLNNLVQVIDVKCDNDDNKQLCIDNNVEGYPTIKLLKDGQVIDFDAKPTKDTLVKFLNTVL